MRCRSDAKMDNCALATDWTWIVSRQCVTTGHVAITQMRACSDCIALIRWCVSPTTFATSIVAVITSNSILPGTLYGWVRGDLAAGICLSSTDTADLFIYTYCTPADFARRGCCGCMTQVRVNIPARLRKRWRIVGALMRCVYTLTASLFSDAHTAAVYVQ